MMLFLMFYLGLYKIDKVFAYCESAVSCLPFEEINHDDLMSNQVR